MKRLFAIAVASFLASIALGQGIPSTQPQASSPFQLNAAQQSFLDQVLAAWEKSSNQVQTFSAPFGLYTYDAFSPAPGIATTIEQGNLSYQKPDKGSFKIDTVALWKADPVPPGYQGPAKGKHVIDPNAVGKHWVCDGKAVYEYKVKEKQLYVQPIPPELQGKSIVDGPLPFLFGAEAKKLKKRFFMVAFSPQGPDGKPNPNVIQISAKPRTIVDAAEYQMVEVQLDRKSFMPISMNVIHPDASRNAYVFWPDKIQINSVSDRLSWLGMFASPRTPLGWQKVIDRPQQHQAAGVPQQAPR